MHRFNRRNLQISIAILSLIPILAGLGGMSLGPRLIGSLPPDGLDFDSHWRYLSGLLFAIGLGFWSTIPRIETKSGRFRLLTLLVVMGGLGRLASALLLGWPGLAMILALVMELVVTPALAIWQALIARAAA